MWVIFALLDPDPDSEYRTDPDPLTRSNPDPIRIRIRNPGKTRHEKWKDSVGTFLTF